MAAKLHVHFERSAQVSVVRAEPRVALSELLRRAAPHVALHDVIRVHMEHEGVVVHVPVEDLEDYTILQGEVHMFVNGSPRAQDEATVWFKRL